MSANTLFSHKIASNDLTAPSIDLYSGTSNNDAIYYDEHISVAHSDVGGDVSVIVNGYAHSLNQFVTSMPTMVNATIHTNQTKFNDDALRRDYIFDRIDVRIIFISLYAIVFFCCFCGKSIYPYQCTLCLTINFDLYAHFIFRPFKFDLISIETRILYSKCEHSSFSIIHLEYNSMCKNVYKHIFDIE